ncbi:MAG: hypothetical protein OXH09_04245, partial [Gammaproteobacteria bacterium]|nr:hypothetical protein [Gammaproteobacteria bacterium]
DAAVAWFESRPATRQDSTACHLSLWHKTYEAKGYRRLVVASYPKWNAAAEGEHAYVVRLMRKPDGTLRPHDKDFDGEPDLTIPASVLRWKNGATATKHICSIRLDLPVEGNPHHVVRACVADLIREGLVIGFLEDCERWTRCGAGTAPPSSAPTATPSNCAPTRLSRSWRGWSATSG